ncbi:DUF72 domain-containing protein [Falsiroseomonas tokyonensis]|uniref:DUF72 domain-containing protein n=1 Tax=Falsiroseomonas tokyonensis TaxID=430521 RepID=A0ABV7BR15_9PROT|nr:DUF72 domain-containing protein [Falsiroseomonas tokyonensis]MBU8537258.1 DUF72 domain-containing protein [Falsiroseomonas tokyonensis]
MAAKIRVGIGGWTFEPWRDNFFPKGLPQKQELHFASRQVTAIEINGTYYGSQKPESFARWHDEAPEDFVFSLKASRFTTNRKVLAESEASVARFLASGLTELKAKLGPINWQFLPTKQFEPDDFEAFLQLLPKTQDGVALRHVVEVRHPSFAVPEFPALLRRYGIGVVVADSDKHPAIHDVTAPFVYARLQNAAEEEALGYPEAALDAWAERARIWAKGGVPKDLPLLAPAEAKPPKSREVFVFMINGFKPKAPHAAKALLERL